MKDEQVLGPRRARVLTTSRLEAPEPTFRELFTPKLVTVLREGYDLRKFQADALSGLTVAIVALPLSMAIAIASGVTPDRGLYTAIVAGFLISALGGSRFQIGGPAGAFIVLVAATVDRHGYDGLALATMMAGLILMAIGFLRLGTYIKYIPHPVTIGFTAGIAVIIFDSQLRELFGLTLPGKEPGPLIPKLAAFWQAIGTINTAAVGIAAVTIGIILGLRRYRPNWPGFLIAVVIAAVLTAVFQLPVETIGSRFGGMPRSLPSPHLPDISLERVQTVLPDAFTFALLGGIESLLSAVVADAMSGRRHRSNCELVAQGFANIGAALFGGLCATGTIARTATNVRARRDRACLGHPACAVPARLHAGRGAARRLHPACRARRHPCGRCLEHGRAARVPRHPDPLARRGARAARDLPSHRVPGSHRRHPGRRGARQLLVHAPHGGARRGRGRASPSRRGRGRCRRQRPDLSGPTGHPPGGHGLPDRRPPLLRRRQHDRDRFRAHRAVSKNRDHRSVRRAARRLDRGGIVRALRQAGPSPRRPGVRDRGDPAGPARAAAQGLRRPVVRFAPSVADARMAALHSGG